MRLLLEFEDMAVEDSGLRYMGSGVVGAIEGVGGRVEVIGDAIVGLSAKLSLEVVGRGVSSTVRESTMSGLSKSQRTPCLTQFPHRGWTSSHFELVTCQL